LERNAVKHQNGASTSNREICRWTVTSHSRIVRRAIRFGLRLRDASRAVARFDDGIASAL
jgi:hypothetical protein